MVWDKLKCGGLLTNIGEPCSYQCIILLLLSLLSSFCLIISFNIDDQTGEKENLLAKIAVNGSKLPEMNSARTLTDSQLENFHAKNDSILWRAHISSSFVSKCPRQWITSAWRTLRLLTLSFSRPCPWSFWLLLLERYSASLGKYHERWRYNWGSSVLTTTTARWRLHDHRRVRTRKQQARYSALRWPHLRSATWMR